MTAPATTPTIPDRSGGASHRSLSLSVVVLTLNAEDSVGRVLENLPAAVDEVVLVDGLSIDATELVVAEYRPDAVVVHQRTRGREAALRAGLLAASGDRVLAVDGNRPGERAGVLDRLLIAEGVRRRVSARGTGRVPADPDHLRLVPTLVPAYGSGRWRPAGSETRSWSELRAGDDLMQVLVAVDGADPRLRPAIARGDLDTLQALAC